MVRAHTFLIEKEVLINLSEVRIFISNTNIAYKRLLPTGSGGINLAALSIDLLCRWSEWPIKARSVLICCLIKYIAPRRNQANIINCSC